MNISGEMNIAGLFLELKRDVEAVTFPGDFLLSVNRFSHRWIYLEELWRDPTNELIRDILKVVFINFLAEHGPFTVFAAGSFTGTSEEELPVYMIAHDAIQSLGTDKVKLLRIVAEPLAPLEAKGEILPGKYVGVFAMSVHIELIKKIVEILRRNRCEVTAIVTILEREPTSRKELSDLGVELVPMIFFDEAGERLQTILEMSAWPYRTMHRYFREKAQQSDS